MATCIFKDCDTPLTGRQTRFCSDRHRKHYGVDQWRKRTKQKCVEYLGGECVDCGYSRCMEAMHFHHVKGQKEFGIGQYGHTRSWERIRAELDKCVLVCANCHAERHASTSLESCPGD